MDQRSDNHLIRAIADGDPEALMALHDRYARIAFALAYRILSDPGAAEEAVQDAYMVVWRRASTFDGTHGKVRAWLLTIVHHRAIDIRRQWMRHYGQPLDLDGIEHWPPGFQAPDPWDDVTLELDRQHVRSAVAALPDDQRRAIELSYFDGLSHREIAEQTGLPLGTVKSRVRLGLQKLASYLEGSRTDAPRSAPHQPKATHGLREPATGRRMDEGHGA